MFPLLVFAPKWCLKQEERKPCTHQWHGNSGGLLLTVHLPKIWPLPLFANRIPCTLLHDAKELNLNSPTWAGQKFHGGVIQEKTQAKATLRKVSKPG